MKDVKFLGYNPDYYGINNDILFLKGDIVLTEGSARVKQKIVKDLLTTIGEHLVFAGYGTNLQNFINSRNIRQEDTQRQIRDEVIYALSYLEAIETSESDDEHMKEINKLEIVFDEDDPRKAYIRIVLTLRNNENLLVLVEI